MVVVGGAMRTHEHTRATGRTVLLVEDETPLRTIIARNLVQRGHRLIAVDSVGDAIAEMTTRLPDVVLLDVNLPDGTGWEVLRWLRAVHHHVAVIVYSAVPPSTKRIAEFRPDAVLMKPFPMDSLVELIATVGVSNAATEQE
ncbi:MAG: response regulator [Chloroflexota bacterium]|nr:response regulator [Chloroflexota bacterium]